MNLGRSALSSLGPLLRAAGMELTVHVMPDLTERAVFVERLPARRGADALLVFTFDLTEEEMPRWCVWRPVGGGHDGTLGVPRARGLLWPVTDA